MPTENKKLTNDKNEEIVKVDLLDVLLDENNKAPIYMYDDKGNQLEFEQVAVIPYGEDDLYCILKPITKIEGVKDDEAIVFLVTEDEREEVYKQALSSEWTIMMLYVYYLSIKCFSLKEKKDFFLCNLFTSWDPCSQACTFSSPRWHAPSTRWHHGQHHPSSWQLQGIQQQPEAWTRLP